MTCMSSMESCLWLGSINSKEEAFVSKVVVVVKSWRKKRNFSIHVVYSIEPTGESEVPACNVVFYVSFQNDLKHASFREFMGFSTFPRVSVKRGALTRPQPIFISQRPWTRIVHLNK